MLTRVHCVHVHRYAKSGFMKSILFAAVASILLLAALPAPGDEAGPPESRPEAARASGADAFGWRGDGSGIFPHSTPPTHWDSTTNKGILWTAKIGKGMHGSPILAGDR